MRFLSQLPTDVHAQIVPHRAGDTEIQLVRLSTTTRTVSLTCIVPPVSELIVHRLHDTRFQKAIKKVRATQRMRRQRGFAFSQTESNNQDQERLIRSYDTSVQRPSGY